MIGRLAEAGLLRHAPYHGVELTERGAAVALAVIRHHRLWELFLHRALGVPLDQLHDEAERLEHELSDALEERMTRLLGDPTHDPHGDPIPTREGTLADPAYPTLASLVVGGAGVVRRIPDRDPELLRYIGSLGLLPGAEVELRAREPFDGPLTLGVGADERVIGHELARRVQVEPRADRAPSTEAARGG
jgi:DtxR family Mn-dependent transcriptional regulator